MKIAVILPAAGQGRRFAEARGRPEPATSGDSAPGASGGSKIEADLAGRAVFLRAVELFLNRPQVVQVILAVNPDGVDDFRFRWGDKLGFHGVELVSGGKTERWETVLKALAAVRDECTHVAIHDAARPLTSDSLIKRVFEAAQTYPAVIPGLPVSATLKRTAALEPAENTDAGDPLDAILGPAGKPPPVRRVTETVDRTDLVEVQTPQVFELGLLRRAYAALAESSGAAPGAVTDDARLVEALGQRVYVVEGEPTNLKITRPDDLKLAAAILRATAERDAALEARKRLLAQEPE